MSIQLFCQRLTAASFGKNDQEWFPRWIRRYRSASQKSVGDSGELVVSKDLVIRFCRNLLSSGTPAWQRLQAVRAVIAYRDLVLNSSEPCLQEVRQTLNRLAQQEKMGDTGSSELSARDVVGVIDENEPAILQEENLK